MPGFTCFDADAVALHAESRRKMERPSPTRQRTAQALQAPPSLQKAGSELLSAAAKTMGPKKRALWEPTEEEDDEEGEARSTAGGGSRDMPGISCLICGDANKWGRKQRIDRAFFAIDQAVF